MSIYTKDHLLDGKIVYFQPKLGYRSGIEPIILASQAHNKDKSLSLIHISEPTRRR